jgi:lysozyme
MASKLNDAQNPLMRYRTYVVKNVLVAFQTTSDAVNTKIDYSVGKTGIQITGTGCGKPGIVVVNEFIDARFLIYNHTNEFNFHSFFDHSTSSMTGSITITDAVGGYFQNFLRDDVAAKLGVAETHLIFALKTFFIGTTYDGKEEIVTVKPLIFHMYNLAHSYNNGDSAHNFYSIMYVADYNTFALLPNYSKMFQMTITHQDSGSSTAAVNVAAPTQTPVPTATIKATPSVTPTPVVSLTPTPTVTDGAAASTFDVSQAGINLVKEFEGCILHAYFDVNGYSIGYGHHKGVSQNDVITQDQADAFLKEDLVWAVNAVRTKVTVLLNQGQFDALVDLTYNLGAAGYKGLLATLNSGDYAGAQSSFSKYVYAGGVVNQSLVNRRAAEAAIFGGQPAPAGNQPAPSQPNLDHKSGQGIDVKAKNQALSNYRDARIKSNKTMMTIKDIMNGFEAALKAQKTPPSSTLAQWLSTINTNYVNSLIPNDQKKSGGVLPIDYSIKLDPAYDNYVIDNRNIPFEQPEQSQLSAGIKVYQVKPGKMLTKVVNNLMKLSNQVGDDALASLSMQKSYKCNISCVKTCDDRYEFDIHISRYIVPLNSTTIDTGPGNNESFYKPLGFTYQKDAKDRDIINLSMSLFSDSDLGIMSQPNNSTDNHSIYGNREQIMLERNPDIDFFKTSFSGNRGMANPKNYGLERPNGPVSIDNLIKTNLAQTSKLYVTIIGNPNLLSDLFRNPIKVVAEDADNPNFYKFPEYYPMYAKLDIYMKPSNNIGLNVDKNTPRQYYYSGYYHLANIKTSITGSMITQVLEMYRTDDKT